MIFFNLLNNHLLTLIFAVELGTIFLQRFPAYKSNNNPGASGGNLRRRIYRQTQ